MTKRYDEYKDSGIEWIGEIPSHWKIKKIKSIFKGRGGLGFAEEDQGLLSGDYPFYKVSDTNNVGNEKYLISSNNYVYRNQKYDQNKIPKGSIIAPKVGEALRSNKRRILSTDSLIDNNMLALIPKTRINSEYYYYLMLFFDFNKLLNGGAVPSVNYSSISNEEVLFPEILEQQAIADYLDNKTSKIDSAVAELEKQKSLLIELKKSTIHQAVTKGLDLTVPMKDSRIEWIGEVPSHWNMDKLKNKTINFDSKRIPISASERVAGQYPYYGATKIVDYVDSFIFDGRYLLIGEDGAPFFDKSKKLSFIVDGKFWVNNHAHIMKTKNYNMDYLSYFLNSKNYGDVINGSTREKLTKSDLQEIIITNPKTKEQEKIANYLDKKTGQIDKSIEVIDNQIAKMKEYKKTLINDVVTGKIKVV